MYLECDDDDVDTKPRRQLIFTTKFLLDLIENNDGKASDMEKNSIILEADVYHDDQYGRFWPAAR